jgi:hypothetical protein
MMELVGTSGNSQVLRAYTRQDQDCQVARRLENGLPQTHSAVGDVRQPVAPAHRVSIEGGS